MSYRFSMYAPDTEKTSAYECGFDPYEDARNVFDIRFYLVAMLTLLFFSFNITRCQGSGPDIVEVCVDLLLAAAGAFFVYLAFSRFHDAKSVLDSKEDQMLDSLNELQDLMGPRMSPATPFSEWPALSPDSKIEELRGLEAGIDEVHSRFSHLLPNYMEIKEHIELIAFIISKIQALTIKLQWADFCLAAGIVFFIIDVGILVYKYELYVSIPKYLSGLKTRVFSGFTKLYNLFRTGFK
jgi:hypothetical protein